MSGAGATARPVRLADAELRFGDWGPGYLSQAEHAAFGTIVLRPGDEFANHLHEHHEESFLAVEGEAELWIDREGPVRLAAGEFVSCPPNVEHFLRNTSGAPFRALFIKAPGVAADKIDRPWHPGDRPSD